MPPEDTAVVATETTAAPQGQPKDTAAQTAQLIAKYAAAAPQLDDAPEEVKAEIKAKPEPKPEAKAKPAAKAEPKPAKIDPKSIKLETEPAKAEPEPDGNSREKARYYLQHGDVAKAIETALGDLTGLAVPDDVREALARKLGVKSDQWEKVRKYEKSVKQQFAQKEQHVSQLVEQVRREYEPLVTARQAYQAGDYEAAFKAAFGEDIADFQRKAISQRISKNPEVEQVKALLERERQERLRDKQELELQRQKAAEEREVGRYMANLQTELTQSPDPTIAKYAERPRFIQRVFQIQAEHYNPTLDISIPINEAAEIARDEILNLINEWEYTGSDTAKSVQAAAPPEQPPPAKARGRNLRHTTAAEATSSPKKLTTEELIKKHARLMELSQH